MSSTIAIVVFFAGLLVVILIHEAGHYTVARLFGFKVQEYFVGFGPRLWSFRRGEIEYGVKALPLGGYVKIAGMNPYEPVAPEDISRSYGAKPIWQRALVIFAGPGSHLIVGALMFSSLLFFFGDPRVMATAPLVGSVESTLNGAPSPASLGGLQPGDTIVGAGDIQNPTKDQLRDVITAHAVPTSSPLTFTVLRDGKTFQVDMTPVAAKDDQGKPILDDQGKPTGRIGIVLPDVWAKPGLAGSITGGVTLVGETVTGSFQQIGHVFGPHGIGRIGRLLFTDTPRTTSDPTTVVGIGQQVGATGAAGDWGSILYLLGFLTVFVGLINLVPLPPFDGGHLFVLVLEKIRGKAIDMRKLIPVSAVVMAFLVTFVLANVYLDIAKPIPSP
jgi:membrane-associated protease RseP (regulator of RpoE activity)